MGWDYIRANIGSPDAYLRSNFTVTRPGYVQTVVDTAWVGRVCYMALRCQHEAAPRDCIYANRLDYVAALVILTDGSGQHGFGYKAMDESMGPVECRAPRRLLRLLSPLSEHGGTLGSWAADWRARCGANQGELAL